ncbi:unnamed protein product [Rhizophagus irregularis]|nr:unnamed protein product [Rhizophagus irregularis]
MKKMSSREMSYQNKPVIPCQNAIFPGRQNQYDGIECSKPSDQHDGKGKKAIPALETVLIRILKEVQFLYEQLEAIAPNHTPGGQCTKEWKRVTKGFELKWMRWIIESDTGNIVVAAEPVEADYCPMHSFVKKQMEEKKKKSSKKKSSRKKRSRK